MQLRYAQQWNNPVILDGVSPSSLRAGMNADGLVALARPGSGEIIVHTATPGDEWSAEESLPTDGAATIDFVSVTDDAQVIVVWRIAPKTYVSTLDGDGWSTVKVPGDHVVTRVAAGADLQGNVVIARAVSDDLYVSFRSADGSVTQPEQMADDLAYGCSYTCVAVEVLPGGDAVVAWSPQGQLVLGRRDSGTGTWRTEVVDPSFGPLSVRLDAHDDGSVTLANTSETTVSLCSWTSPCTEVDYPPGTDHGMFAAAPGRSAVAISGRSWCDDWCDFNHLAGYVWAVDTTRSGWER